MNASWLILSLLSASLVALAVGPALFHVLRKRPGALDALDGFVVVTIGGLVLLHILPHAIETAGAWAPAAVLVGLLGPVFAERSLERFARQAHAAAVVTAFLGISLHALLDGVAIGVAGLGAEAGLLALAVVIHRIPVGATVWLLLRPPYGARVAGAVLGLVAAATLAGFGLRGIFAPLQGEIGLAIIQALVGGSLLHVVIHRARHGVGRDASDHATGPAAPRPGWKLSAGVGALLGVALLVSLHLAANGLPGEAHLEEQGPTTLGEIFIALALTSAPALLLGYAAAGMMGAFLPRGTVRWMRRGGSLVRAAKGVAFGLPLPICSCGVVPLYDGLVRRGAPAAAAMAFLVATPELGVDAVLLSLPLLGPELTIARVVAAGLVAMLVGIIVGRLADRSVPPAVEEDSDGADLPAGLMSRLSLALRTGFGEVFESTAPWILAGLYIAALADPMLAGGALGTVPAWLQVPLFALLGMPTYVCASGATPLAAVLVAQGASPGAALAFLLTGPATNVTTYGVLSGRHGRPVALAFAGTMASLAIVAGYVVDIALPSVQVFSAEGGVHGATALQMGALAILGGALLIALLRTGPRELVETVIPTHSHAEHDHDAHEHDHTERDDDEKGSVPSCGCSGSCGS